MYHLRKLIARLHLLALYRLLFFLQDIWLTLYDLPIFTSFHHTTKAAFL